MTQEAPDRATREPSHGGKRLVLVVQGIGDEAPGATVGSLARSMATAAGRSRAPVEEVSWLAEGSGRQIEKEEFPCHVERLRAGTAESVLAEVYWADLSRPGHGIPALLQAVFRALFGLHHAAARYAAAPPRRPGSAGELAARVLEKLSLASAYLVRGPAAAASVHFGLLSAVTFAALTIGGDLSERSEPAWVAGIFLTANSIAFLGGGWGFRRRRSGPFRALFLWLALFGVMGLLYWLASLAWFGSWIGEVTTGKSWLFAADLTNIPVFLAFCLVALAMLPWLVARLRAGPSRRPAIDFAQAVNVLVLGVWVLVVQFLYLAVYSNLPQAAEEARQLATTVSSFMALYCLVAILPAGALIATFVRQRTWARVHRASGYPSSGPAPRLLLGRGFVTSLIVLPLLLLTPFLVPPIGAWAAGTFGNAWRVVVPVAALVAAVVVYVSEQIRTLLDFALDIVAYFETERSQDDGRLVFARRERIHERLRIVLEALVRQERPDRVTVLAHSLGTMVAIDTLAQQRAEALLEPVANTDLVTMASPFHHVFQHYLCGEYPPLDHDRWNGLRRRLERWINIFRIDDYVGTDIEPDGDWPENVPVHPGGHTYYWSDRQVLQILDDRQLV